MTPKECMLNLMADIIGVNDTFAGDKLNDETVWQNFMQEVFKRMDSIEDDEIRHILSGVDKEEFQAWIDDPAYWQAIDEEIVRRGNLIKTILPSNHQGYC